MCGPPPLEDVAAARRSLDRVDAVNVRKLCRLLDARHDSLRGAALELSALTHQEQERGRRQRANIPARGPGRHERQVRLEGDLENPKFTLRSSLPKKPLRSHHKWKLRTTDPKSTPLAQLLAITKTTVVSSSARPNPFLMSFKR